ETSHPNPPFEGREFGFCFYWSFRLNRGLKVPFEGGFREMFPTPTLYTVLCTSQSSIPKKNPITLPIKPLKMQTPKLLRITTVPISLKTLLKGQHRFMSENGFEVIGVSSDGKELKEVAHDEGIRTIPLEMSRTISPL